MSVLPKAVIDQAASILPNRDAVQIFWKTSDRDLDSMLASGPVFSIRGQITDKTLGKIGERY